jgi:hypothetical protein
VSALKSPRASAWLNLEHGGKHRLLAFRQRPCMTSGDPFADRTGDVLGTQDRRRGPRRALGLLLSVLVATTVLLGETQPAFAHSVWFTIWNYGTVSASGTDDHFWFNPFCTPNCPYDYYIATYVTVWQSYAGQGNFYWETLDLPGGGIFQSTGGAIYGQNTWIYDAQGVAHQVADIFCTSVTTPTYLTAGIWNNGSQGFWVQDSGYGQGTCYSAYTVNDHMNVQAGQ